MTARLTDRPLGLSSALSSIIVIRDRPCSGVSVPFVALAIRLAAVGILRGQTSEVAIFEALDDRTAAARAGRLYEGFSASGQGSPVSSQSLGMPGLLASSLDQAPGHQGSAGPCDPGGVGYDRDAPCRPRVVTLTYALEQKGTIV